MPIFEVRASCTFASRDAERCEKQRRPIHAQSSGDFVRAQGFLCIDFGTNGRDCTLSVAARFWVMVFLEMLPANSDFRK